MSAINDECHQVALINFILMPNRKCELAGWQAHGYSAST